MNTSSCLRKANEPTNCLVCGKDVSRCALFVWREISNPTESLVFDKAKHRSFTYLFQIFPSNHGIRCDQRSGERWGGFTRILCAKESRIFSFAAVCVIDLSYRRGHLSEYLICVEEVALSSYCISFHGLFLPSISLPHNINLCEQSGRLFHQGANS